MAEKKRRLPSLKFLLVSLIIILSLAFLIINRITGNPLLPRVFQIRRREAVYSTLERIDDLALLECAVFRIRVVYPYDVPRMAENLPVLDDKDDFCVLSAQVTAGYDLSALLNLRANPRPPVSLEDGRVMVRLGPPEITSLRVDDKLVNQEVFPDIKITPEEWRIIVDAMKPRIRDMALENGILEEAESYGRDFFTGLFQGAGYECFFETNEPQK